MNLFEGEGADPVTRVGYGLSQTIGVKRAFGDAFQSTLSVRGPYIGEFDVGKCVSYGLHNMRFAHGAGHVVNFELSTDHGNYALIKENDNHSNKRWFVWEVVVSKDLKTMDGETFA